MGPQRTYFLEVADKINSPFIHVKGFVKGILKLFSDLIDRSGFQDNLWVDLTIQRPCAGYTILVGVQ